MYNGEMTSEVFDMSSARRELLLRREALLAECDANNRLQTRFDAIAQQLRKSNVQGGKKTAANQRWDEEDEEAGSEEVHRGVGEDLEIDPIGYASASSAGSASGMSEDVSLSAEASSEEVPRANLNAKPSGQSARSRRSSNSNSNIENSSRSNSNSRSNRCEYECN